MLSRKLLVATRNATPWGRLCAGSRRALHTRRLGFGSQAFGQAPSRSASAFATSRAPPGSKTSRPGGSLVPHLFRQPAAEGTENAEHGWEPDPEVFRGIDFPWRLGKPSLEELVYNDLDTARKLFNSKLKVKYRREMRMWNKWAVMEWKAKNFSLSRTIFRKASKISFHVELWQSWASMELEDRNYQEAKRLYNVILATDPSPEDAKMAKLGLALIEAAVGSLENARSKFFELAHQDPDDGHLLVAYAQFEAKQANNLPTARDLFRRACSLITANSKVWHAWAKAEFDHGIYRNAQSILQSGLKRFPRDQWLIKLLAETYMELDDIKAARRLFMDVTTDAAFFDASCYNAFGSMEERLGNSEAAMRMYNLVLIREPGNVATLTSLALLIVKEKGIDDARRLLKKHSTHITDHGHFCNIWGNLEERYGELQYAKRLYEDATRVDPRHIESWKALSRVEALLGDINAARSVLMMASQHCPSDVALLLQLAKVEQLSSNTAAARRACEKALRVDPARADAWNLRATLELPHQPERAKRLVQRALREIPTHERFSRGVLFCTLGRSLVLSDNLEEAVGAFEASFRCCRTNWMTHKVYADCVLIPNGELEEAKRHYAIAIDHAPRTRKESLRANLNELALHLQKKREVDQVVADSPDLLDSHDCDHDDTEDH